jgi:hypothetical protein
LRRSSLAVCRPCIAKLRLLGRFWPARWADVLRPDQREICLGASALLLLQVESSRLAAA